MRLITIDALNYEPKFTLIGYTVKMYIIHVFILLNT